LTPENVTDRFDLELLQKIGKDHQLLHFESASLAGNGDNFDFDSVDTGIQSGIVDLLSVGNSTDHEFARRAHKAGAVDSDEQLVLSLYQKTL